ncbi:hypothetical protein PDO_0631 [Rhizobium sp. PDO1-076]|uniref:hypothetical protein n=1 Tax=Rhizobium sp. PDO1-076 TaxID=1125979 RepID=UPI00024E29F7|nr:hypothetical protein [Rhizobium sp. PDO1-076]EHS49253.1 hypothetical protein PDO_0631 [Rhizobium sp. PDO1-076]
MIVAASGSHAVLGLEVRPDAGRITGRETGKSRIGRIPVFIVAQFGFLGLQIKKSAVTESLPV